MNELEKLLVSKGDVSLSSGEAALNEVKQLLASNANNEINTLKSIGLDNDIKFIEAQKEDFIIRSQSAKKFERPVVSRADIQSILLDYRLYMKPAREYIGRIPADLGAELTRFCADKSIPLPASSEYSNFFIIAPPKMFKGYQSPMEIALGALNVAQREAERRRVEAAKDPILVYKIDDTHFAVVKSWGNDFTPLRRFYGFITRRSFIKPFLALGTVAIIVGMVAINVAFWFYIDSISHRGMYPAIILLAAFGLGIATILLWVWMGVEGTISRTMGTLIRQFIHRTVTHQNEGGPEPEDRY